MTDVKKLNDAVAAVRAAQKACVDAGFSVSVAELVADYSECDALPAVELVLETRLAYVRIGNVYAPGKVSAVPDVSTP